VTNTWRWTRKQWFALPLAIRNRWWKETDYAEKAPSPELVAIIERWLFEHGHAILTL